MTSKHQYRRGEIVLLPFPYTDLSGQKQRPALVLTDTAAGQDCIMLPITSQAHHLHSVELKQNGLASGNLPKDSWIKADKPYTLNASLIRKSFGKVKPEIMQAAASILCSQLGCK